MGLEAGLRDIGMEVGVAMKGDASAAAAIASRRGLEKGRHNEVRQLRLQDKARKGEVKAERVGTSEKAADALTKHLNSDSARQHGRDTRHHRALGRREQAPLKEE